MKVMVRKGPPPRDLPHDTDPQVVMEVWMTTSEALDLDLNSLPFGDAVSDAISEHVNAGRRGVHRVVRR